MEGALARGLDVGSGSSGGEVGFMLVAHVCVRYVVLLDCLTFGVVLRAGRYAVGGNVVGSRSF